jgi:carbamoyl-phosphate synthase large subunit
LEELNILLLGAGNRVSLCEWFSKAGTFYNRKVNIVSLEAEKTVPIKKYAKILKGVKWKDPEFYKQLERTISENNIHLVIPLMDAGCVELSKFKDQLESQFEDLWCVVSSYNICKTFDDKVLTDRWFRSRKVLVPELGTKKFPRILKLKNGYGSRNQKVLYSEEELDSFKKYNKIPYDEYIEQEYIEGVEYTIDAYVSREKELLGAVSRERLLVVNGEVSRSVTKREEDLLLEVRRILVDCTDEFEGPITLQFIKSDLNKKWYAVEINTRLGGGVICSLKAGADYTKAIVGEYLEESLPNMESWVDGLLMMRANQEIWQYKG